MIAYCFHLLSLLFYFYYFTMLPSITMQYMKLSFIHIGMYMKIVKGVTVTQSM